MNRFRFVLVFVALSTLALVAMASADSPIDPVAVDGFCNKLCIIGFHSVPTPSGGVCVPDHGAVELSSTGSEDSSEMTPVTGSAGLDLDSVAAQGQGSCGHGIRACSPALAGQPCDPKNLSIVCSRQSNGHYCCLAYAP